MFPGIDANLPHPAHASVLLIALMTGASPSKSAEVMQLFADLPLSSAVRGVTQAGGEYLAAKIPADDPFMDNLRSWGDSFGVFLSCLIAWFNEAREVDFEVLSLDLGGGLGTAHALISFVSLVEGVTFGGNVKFDLAPLGGGFIPDDAPRSRLERHAAVPGSIFPILRELFTGDTNGPREVFMSRAELARLSEEGHS